MKQKKILIVEDDGDVRHLLNVRLRAHDYETVYAEDAVGAVSCARKERPDLVLLDLGLPAGDGHLVMQRFRQNPALATTPVIVVSARDPRTEAEKSLASGAVAFLHKPVDNDELLATIQLALSETPTSA